MEFRAVKEIWNDGITLYAKTQYGGEVKAIVADGLKVIDVEKGMLWPKFLELPMMDGAGQSLFNALWEAGFRPANGESSQAHVNALNDHLQDMRALVFDDKPIIRGGPRNG